MDEMPPEEARAELARLQTDEKRTAERQERDGRLTRAYLDVLNRLGEEHRIWCEVYVAAPEEDREGLRGRQERIRESIRGTMELMASLEAGEIAEEEKRAGRRRLEERAKEVEATE